MRVSAFLLILLLASACRDIPPPPAADEDRDTGDVGAADTDPDEDAGCVQRCDGDTLVTCSGEDEVRTACTEGTQCVDGGCAAVMCEPGRSVCDGDDVLSCPPEGGTATRLRCNDTTQCQEAERGCGCQRGQCTPRICEPDTWRCVGVGPQQCAGDGLSWHQATMCEGDQMCVDGACEDRVCEPDTASCDGDLLRECNETGTAEQLSNCAAGRFYCDPEPSPHCQDWACVPSEVRCSDDLTAVLTCNARGSAESADPCVEGQFCDELFCRDRVCEPNAVLCVGGDVHVCNAQGSASILQTDCPDGVQACEQGQCLPIVCDAGVATCDGERLTACNDSGTELFEADCAQSQSYCDLGTRSCIHWVCLPGSEPQCEGGDVQQCDARGTQFQVVVECVGDQVCLDAACRDPICDPGTSVCEGDVLQVCADNGVDLTEQDCTQLMAYCDAESPACVDWVCDPDDGRFCQDGDTYGCNERGTAVELLERCGGRGCLDGDCNRLPLGSDCADDAECESLNCSQAICTPEAFALVPAGSFTMGSPDAEPGRSAQEGPQHTVQITQALWFMRAEVTQRDWSTLMRNNPSGHRGDSLRPVETVSWFDALAYANALSRDEGLAACYDLGDCTGAPGTGNYACPAPPSFSPDCAGYRLPTEAEWEYAARAGTDTALPTGDMDVTDCGEVPNLDAIGWYCGNADGMSHPVEQKAPNPWGLHDTAGNVFEWVWDWYASAYYAQSPPVDPPGPESGIGRVIRGGAWNFQARGARSAFRLLSAPGSRQDYLGFRLVRRPPP